MDGPPFSGMTLLRRSGPVDLHAATDGDGARVAVKVLDPARAANDPVGARRFRREAQLAASLDHPGIVACRASGDGWFALEWLEDGLDRAGRQADHGSPEALRRLLAALADTLAYLHGRGVVHADLKPSHVRFRGERPVLIDLGIAALGSRDPLFEGEFAGSPRWMAPELLEGGTPSPASDIWSLSAIGAWLWTGAPASADDPETVLQRRLREADARGRLPEALRPADAELYDLLAAGLDGPEGRPLAAQIVQLISRSTAG